MEEFLGRIIDFNEKNINFTAIFTICFSYFFLLWLIISLWVGVDAWKRFNNRTVGLIFFLLTLLLNFPILIFYFVIRPEFKYEEYEEWNTGGVCVPIVNFVGDKGIEMALELKINPSKISPSTRPDMKVDVSWESAKEQMKLQKDEKVQDGQKELKKKVGEERKVSNIFSIWKGLVSKRISKIKFFPPRKKQKKQKKQEKKKIKSQENQKSDKKVSQAKEKGKKK